MKITTSHRGRLLEKLFENHYIVSSALLPYIFVFAAHLISFFQVLWTLQKLVLCQQKSWLTVILSRRFRESAVGDWRQATFLFWLHWITSWKVCGSFTALYYSCWTSLQSLPGTLQPGLSWKYICLERPCCSFFLYSLSCEGGAFLTYGIWWPQTVITVWDYTTWHGLLCAASKFMWGSNWYTHLSTHTPPKQK